MADQQPARPEASGAEKTGLMARHHLEDLWVRAASALVLVVFAVTALFLGGTAYALFWLVGALAVHWEWQRLIGAPLPWIRMFAGWLALGLAAVLCGFEQQELAFLLLLLASGFCAWAAGRGRLLWAGAGVLYAGGLLFAALLLRHDDIFGLCAIAWLFAVVWGTDVCAYFGGRLIGGAKLCLRISPGKTWSGFVVGIICGAVLGVAAIHFGAEFHFWPNVARVGPVLALGLVTGALAQGGDLLESWIKRRFDVKDSSRLIPGHGGFMDRLDGFVAAAIFAAFFGFAHGQPGAAAGLFYWP
jgi:phosphatidate cytidylyltransferase